MMASRIGYSNKNEDYKALINQYDTNKDGQLDISEFRAIQE